MLQWESAGTDEERDQVADSQLWSWSGAWWEVGPHDIGWALSFCSAGEYHTVGYQLTERAAKELAQAYEDQGGF